MKTVTYADLRIGDIVRLSGIEGYNDATVYNVANGNVHLVRPYVHTADFTHSGGVITYLGQEDFSVPANDVPVILLASRDPNKTRLDIARIVNDIRAHLENGRVALALNELRKL